MTGIRMKMERVVEVNNMNARIDGTLILSDINFHALAGDITVILGKSGSGKTTLLKHLLGLYPTDRDAVSVLGVNPWHLDEKDEKDFYTRLGVFYQNGALLGSMTVGENVGLPLRQHTGLPDDMIERLVSLKLQLVNLEDAYYKLPSQLSGGMLKRAALARAIIMDPPLLLCDEPGAGLDPVSLASLDELILKLRKLLGISVIIVTHEASSILRIADRIVFIEGGTVLFEGGLEDAMMSSIVPVREFFDKGRGK